MTIDSKSLIEWAEDMRRNIKEAPEKVGEIIAVNVENELDGYDLTQALCSIAVFRMKMIKTEADLLDEGESSVKMNEEKLRECLDIVIRYPSLINYKLGEEVIKAYNIQRLRKAG